MTSCPPYSFFTIHGPLSYPFAASGPLSITGPLFKNLILKLMDILNKTKLVIHSIKLDFVIIYRLRTQQFKLKNLNILQLIFNYQLLSLTT